MSYDMEFFENAIKALETPKRFKHTLGVRKEAHYLGTVYMPEKADKLALAGLLHDITKDFNTEKQLCLCKEYGIDVDTKSIKPKLLHSKTGCEYARRTFGDEIVDDEVYDGIYYHTTGRANMSLFEAIIYLADYIEDGRTFEDCVVLRNFFYENLKNATTLEEKLDVLQKTMVKSFDLTIKNLIDESLQIDFDTIKARNYFLKTKDAFKNVSMED